MSSLLAFEEVALARGGRMLFERLTFALGPGQAVHVAGPNGSGKSSLIRLAAGLLEAARGRVERTAEAALADDHLALDRELPLGKALALWARSDVGHALEAAGIAPLAPVPVRLLSSGQRKRATLARVYAANASLWLLDEPLNTLDEAGVAALGVAMARHRAGGGAILAASHAALPGEWTRVELGQ
ncbi:MAG: ATP-binding cassette domain-containing protein [Sphingomicrobium sp.]